MYTSMNKLAISTTLLLAASLTPFASASTVTLNFTGPGVSGSLELTYGPGTDSKYPGAYKVTAISGVFTDTNNGLNLINVPIVGLIPVNNAVPEPTNLLAPNDFSRFAVAAGLAPISNGFLTFDNLYYPGGSPQTASDYPLFGGALDIYGLMFSIGSGRVVNFWSNGSPGGIAPFDYGVAVATASQALDYVEGGVTVAPEPGTVALLSSGLALLLLRRRR